MNESKKKSVEYAKALKSTEEQIIKDIKNVLAPVVKGSPFTKLELARRINITDFNENKTISHISLQNIFYDNGTDEILESLDINELINVLDVVEDSI